MNYTLRVVLTPLIFFSGLVYATLVHLKFDKPGNFGKNVVSYFWVAK